MKNIPLLLLLSIPILFWVWGYFDTRGREVKLPNLLKYLYGKHGKSIYKGGFLSQSVGIIFIASYGIALAELKTRLNFIISADHFLIMSGVIMFLSILLDDRFIQYKNNENS